MEYLLLEFDPLYSRRSRVFYYDNVTLIRIWFRFRKKTTELAFADTKISNIRADYLSRSGNPAYVFRAPIERDRNHIGQQIRQSRRQLHRKTHVPIFQEPAN